MVWATVYRRSFIVDNNLYFNPLVSFYEDAAYNWLIMPVARKVVTIDDIVYLWVQRNASDSHNSDMEHRIRREAHAEQSAVFYRNLWLKYKDKDDFPKDILQMMQRNGWWSCYKYLGTMVRLRGLRREEIKPTIKRLKDEGIYPYPHAYPRMPEGYPQSLPYKLMWRMMSHECLLKLMLRLRTREG